MKNVKKNKNKPNENIYAYKKTLSNEIKLIRRTNENNTHEVFEEQKIKIITSWRKSENKFRNNLIFNILSFGILHLISLFYPRLYIKLYCIPWPAKECDYFLVENIYDEVELCIIQRKREKLNQNEFSTKNRNNLVDDDNINNEYNNNLKNSKYSFEYKSMKYEYIEKSNEIIPIYMNLSKMKNENIIDFYSEGISTENKARILTERFGKNEYNLKTKLFLNFLYKNQIPSYALILFIEGLEYIFSSNYKNFFSKIVVVVILTVIQILILKININNKYKNEFSLDGNEKKVKVKRNYLLKDDKKKYNIINNIDLLPGDIIYLKENDFVPCDCLIIEGDCFVSQSDLNGNLDICKKISLKRNNKHFNYKHSNINILYHGMKIVKTFSKTNQGYITVLSINIGVNTFKANQYSNIYNFVPRKKGIISDHNLYGSKKMFVFIFISVIFSIAATVLGFSSFFGITDKPTKQIKVSFFIPMLCRSLMSCFLISKNVIIFINVILLQKDNIICFDPSKLFNIGKINKIIFNKTETLSNNSLSINGYHPIYLSSKRRDQLKLLRYSQQQSKELNLKLFEYYQNYLKYIKNISSKNNQKNSKFLVNYSINNINKQEEKIILYLECLLSCNSIENINFEFFGNDLEVQLFNDMKWNIKQHEDNNNYNYLTIKYFKEKNTSEIGKNNSNNRYYYIIKKISDIFPDNYYKLVDSSENISKDNNRKKDLSQIENPNKVQLDILSSDFNRYKLRIYKKFIFNEGISCAVIVYNFLIHKLRFMVKGTPEEIIDKCNKRTIPNDLEKKISFYRKKGLIVLACASKVLDITNYEDNDDDLEYYMEDLAFCGLITLENGCKKNLNNSIEEIKKLNDNLLIISGDNEYNCLSTGYISGIIEDKNIFILDIDENNNKITIKKISSLFSNLDEDNEFDISKITDNDQYSKFGITLSKAGSIINDKKNNKYKYTKTNETTNEKDKDILDFKNKKRKLSKRIKNNNNLNDIINENSEIQRIIKNEKNYEGDIIQDDLNIKNKQVENNNFFDNISKNIQNQVGDSLVEKNLNFMDVYHYQYDFENYEDVKKGVFFISGKLFNYLYKNKDRKGIKKFLEKITEKSKIYFSMSSLDKRFLIDYLGENINNVICTIGQCDNDVDSIISSDIGINIRNPNNQNTILCHFFSSQKDIICLKEIIQMGKLFYENINILEYISFVYTIIINSFIFCCLVKDSDIQLDNLNFLEIEFFLLVFSSSLGKINQQNIYKNISTKLLTIYYIVSIIELVIVKLVSLYLLLYFFVGDKKFDLTSLNKEFISYCFVLCSEFILNTIISFNFNSLYKENPFGNRIFTVISLAYLAYLTSLIFLCSSNMSFDIFNITFFLRNETLMDSFTDKNKLYLSLSIFVDIFGTIIISLVTNFIFRIIIK